MLRERGKEARRRTIFAAAEVLIRKKGSADFSLNELASEAIVSVGTMYNLIGSKATVLYVLLNQSMDRLDAIQLSPEICSPFERALVATEAVAGVYASDPELLKPLYRFLLGVEDPLNRPVFMNRALEFWKVRLGCLHEAGLLPKGLTLTDLAREHQIYFAGLLDQWVQGEVSDAELRPQTRYSSIIRLLALNDDVSRPQLYKELQKAKRQLAQAAKLSAPTSPVNPPDR